MTAIFAIVLAGAVGITGCSGNGTTENGSAAANKTTQTSQDKKPKPKVEDFIWYQASIPDGFGPENFGTEDSAYCIKLAKGKKSINAVLVDFDARSTSKRWATDDGFEDLGATKINGITWYAVRETDGSTFTTRLLSTVTDGNTVKVELVNMNLDDKDARTYLDSFTPSDAKNIRADYNRAIDTKYDDAVAEFGK